MEKETTRNLSIEVVRNYIETLNLNDYDLGGCEVGSDEDCEMIIERVNSGEGTLEEVTNNFLYQVREILDGEIEDEEN